MTNRKRPFPSKSSSKESSALKQHKPGGKNTNSSHESSLDSKKLHNSFSSVTQKKVKPKPPLLVKFTITNPEHVDFLRGRISSVKCSESQRQEIEEAFINFDDSSSKTLKIKNLDQNGDTTEKPMLRNRKSASKEEAVELPTDNGMDSSGEEPEEDAKRENGITLSLDEIKLLMPAAHSATSSDASQTSKYHEILTAAKLLYPQFIKKPKISKDRISVAEYKRMTREYEETHVTPYASIRGNLTIGADLIATVLTLAVAFGFVAQYYLKFDISMTFAAAGVGAMLGLIMDGFLLVLRGEREEKKEAARKKRYSQAMGGVPRGYLYEKKSKTE